jgi:SMODS-associated and fused to various effectors sensor domain
MAEPKDKTKKGARAKATEDKKKSRVPIPPKTQLELWARAAGRCEFRGCNKPLYLDELTKTRDNLSIISHIVAAEPGGPRGNEIDSPRLAKDISNLMLTCRDHGKIIDSKENVPDYPVEVLQEYKKEHEDRIRILTDIMENAKSHVLIFQAPIDGKNFNIDKTQAHQAMLPKYPAKEHPDVIDFSDFADRETEEGYWSILARNTKAKFNDIFKHGTNRRDYKHVSVFALGPIPLLVYLGRLIGDIESVDLYQRHRTTKDWKWKDEPDDFRKTYYQVIEPDTHHDASPIAMLISISGVVDRKKVMEIAGDDCNIYEIAADKPGLDFLSSRLKLEMFCYEYRQLLTKIRSVNGHTKELHLFCATPAPVAIECGRALLPKCDPQARVYDLIKGMNGFVFAFTINQSHTA